MPPTACWENDAMIRHGHCVFVMRRPPQRCDALRLILYAARMSTKRLATNRNPTNERTNERMNESQQMVTNRNKSQQMNQSINQLIARHRNATQRKATLRYVTLGLAKIELLVVQIRLVAVVPEIESVQFGLQGLCVLGGSLAVFGFVSGIHIRQLFQRRRFRFGCPSRRWRRFRFVARGSLCLGFQSRFAPALCFCFGWFRR
mmetsp:Transcript_26251/g.72084  ORF Transcript_26251/g.72084 Transcript_26251/m.72084 type:complete len:203 (+) Transcript_26251:78-686(+)